MSCQRSSASCSSRARLASPCCRWRAAPERRHWLLNQKATDRSTIYRQVLELEFDYQVGKLSVEDYHQLATDLLAQAGELIREERGGLLGELDDEIEREIAAARAAFTAARHGVRSSGGTASSAR